MDDEKRKRRTRNRGKDDDKDDASDTSSQASSTKDQQQGKEKPDKDKSEKKKSAGSSEEAGEMISKDKQAQAEQLLQTVERVLEHIASNELLPMEAARYILHNSVDIQRVAVLQQLHQQLDPDADDASVASLLRDILHAIHAHASEVQLAAVTGVEALLKSLPEATLLQLRTWLVPLLSLETTHASREGWKRLFHKVVMLLPQRGLEAVIAEQVMPLLKPEASEDDKVFGLSTLATVLSVMPSAGLQGMELYITLSSDESAKVRLSVAQQLKCLVPCVPPLAVRERLIMPILRLLLDADLQVSCATFEAVLDMADGVGSEFRRLFLCPCLRQYATNAPPTVLVCVAKNFGRMVHALKDEFMPLPSDIARKVTERDGSASAGKSLRRAAAGNASRSFSPTSPSSRLKTPGAPRSPQLESLQGFGAIMAAGLETEITEWVFCSSEFVKHCQSREADIRAACAFNLPGIAASVPVELRRDIIQCAHVLTKDAQPSIRATIAAGLHELCNYSNDPTTQILPLVPLLLGDPDPLVKEKLVKNLTTLFRSLKTVLAKPEKSEAFFSSLTPLIISYEKEIKRNWRKVAMLVQHMQYFREWFTPNDLFQKYVPLLVGHLTDGAAALNHEICRTITLFLREFKTPDDCLKVLVSIRGMITSLAKSKSAAGRIGFIALVSESANSFSQEFVKATLLPALLPLSVDRVVNVRCNMARVLPKLARFPLLAAQVKVAIDGLAKDIDVDVRDSLKLGYTLAEKVEFSASRNAQLLAEEGAYLLGAENVKRAAEYVEKLPEKAAPAPPSIVKKVASVPATGGSSGVPRR